MTSASILGPDRADLGGEARRVAGGVRVPAAQIAAASAFRPRTSRPALDLRGPGCGALVLVPGGHGEAQPCAGPGGGVIRAIMAHKTMASWLAGRRS
jgi:hypothetical protein